MSNAKNLILALRSALFTLGLWSSLLIYLPLIPIIYPLPLSSRLRVLRGWNWMVIHWLRLTCGVRWRVEGEVPPGGGVIIANHQSTWETFFLPLLVNGPVFVLKRELLRIPVFGWGLALGNPIAIDRAANREALKQILSQGRERLAEGRWVVIFPEGTRAAVGDELRYKPGGAMLACKNGARILPMVHNAGCAWPRGSFLKKPFTITVRLGAVMDTEGRGASEVNAELETWARRELASMPCKEDA